MDIFEETQELISSFQNLVSASPFKDRYYASVASIFESLKQPCRLAITGRVKSGKSSLINVLLGEDYAVVGTTETTATINIFKYGTAPYPDTPILCEFLDGTQKWISKDKLDNLQGFSEQVISEIENIKQLTYFIKDERLKNTILIDTPGIDAVVGDDGEAHQIQTESFLGLRSRHEKETIELSNNADAVILLLGDVAHESDIDFITGFLSNRGNTSCLNTIAVMSQIDLTDERVQNRHNLAKERYKHLSSYVNSVLPISAGLKRYSLTEHQAHKIKEVLSSVSREALDALLLRSAKMYFLPNLPGINIALETRREIYPLGMPFRCFAVACKIIYDYDIPQALKLIDDISGITTLQETINVQFFERSKEIKSEIAIKQILNIIWDILNCDIPISKSNLTDSDIEQLSKRFYNIQISLEELSQITENTNKYFQGLITILENKALFTNEEFDELHILLGDKLEQFDDKRLSYWFTEKNNSSNDIRKNIAQLAYSKYTDLAFK